MKRKDLEKILTSMGYVLVRCNKHYIWFNGKKHLAVPMKNEINKILTKHLLKEAVL